MPHTCWLYVLSMVIIIIGLVQNSLGQIVRLSCRRTTFFELKRVNQRLQSGVLSRKLVKSLIACNLACAANHKCESINFNDLEFPNGKANCELIEATEGVEEWEDDIGWHHYKPASKVFCTL